MVLSVKLSSDLFMFIINPLNHSDTDIPQTIDYFADPIEQDEDMA
jgi:hypothetical protein